MAKRKDINSVLLIGAGPIVIGQGCEFDYSGTQACKVLKEEGCRVILINSNPATIMTDPSMADVTYIEPITPEIIEKIIIKERPDAILPTVGGQTALNCAMELADSGVLEMYNVELIGASREAIKKAENRDLFRKAMDKIGVRYPKSTIVRDESEIESALSYIGLPAIIRASFTLGGLGSGAAYNRDEFFSLVKYGLDSSPIGEVQIDESKVGWNEFEFEVIRDSADNCDIVCSIQNIDPMGVHTGDSITVAPAITLRDIEYQKMRDFSFAILREIGVDTGGSNVQFAIDPKDSNNILVIEMNPRVSRSSALASKATGFPIAKVAAKLAIGYTLNEIRNDCAPIIPASFEPAIDYIVTKIPRFNFDKFPKASKELTTSMKSVGEVMAIGRSFQESLQKAYRSLELGFTGLNEILSKDLTEEQITHLLSQSNPDRLLIIADAMRRGFTLQKLNEITGYDNWFLLNIKEIIDTEINLINSGVPDRKDFLRLKCMGFSDARIAELCNKEEVDIYSLRNYFGIRPVYKRIDTCAAEFPSKTDYLYSCYEYDINPECESNLSDAKKIVILGSGPNRIGQGIEFDYACVHASYAARELGYETVMINCNPETVSTDYDTSNRLYFSPLCTEEVLDILDLELKKGDLVGVIVQLGGQTPLKLAKSIEKFGVRILGTSVDSIDLAEDRERFQNLIRSLGLKQPDNAICYSERELFDGMLKVGFPLLIRPSYVLGGQSMTIIYDLADAEEYLCGHKNIFDHGPVLIDSFLSNAIEVDVDAVSDGESVYVAGVMEHIEEAGIHSGDSTCSIPEHTLSRDIVDELKSQTKKIAIALKVIGLINVQYAIKNNEIYILEVNPRASRTIPFISKATNVPLAKIATYVMLGEKLPRLSDPVFYHTAVKEPVFPFSRFVNADIILGPEMKSTGEVMGIDSSFEMALIKAHIATGAAFPKSGVAFISVKNSDKPASIQIAKTLIEIGFDICATKGTAQYLSDAGIKVSSINKAREGRPHIVDMLLDKKIDLVINTSEGKTSIEDSADIRKTAIKRRIPCITVLSAAKALVDATLYLKNKNFDVRSLQEMHSSAE